MIESFKFFVRVMLKPAIIRKILDTSAGVLLWQAAMGADLHLNENLHFGLFFCMIFWIIYSDFQG